MLFYLTKLKFSQPTHQLLYLPLKSLTSIIRTSYPMLVKMIELKNLNGHTQMVNFPTRISYCDYHSPLLSLLLSSDTSIYSTVVFYWRILIMLLPQSPLTIPQTQKVMPLFTAQLMTILKLTGMVFGII